MAYIAHVVTGVWCGEVSIFDARMCTVCVYQVGYRFQPERRWNHWQLSITEGHKPVVLVPALYGGPQPPKAGTHFTERVERAHDRNLISAVGGIRTHNLLIDSPACYHWAINALQSQYKSIQDDKFPTQKIEILPREMRKHTSTCARYKRQLSGGIRSSR